MQLQSYHKKNEVNSWTMTYVMVDIEADGPIPGEYSMTSIGAVIVDEKLDKTFYAELKPISKHSHPNHLKFSGKTREQIENIGELPEKVMESFMLWLRENCKDKPVFISDNNGFDWMFVCWYFWKFQNGNPFGHSSRNLNSFYKGMRKDMNKNLEDVRPRPLTHNALEDAKDNAKAFLFLINEYRVEI